MDGEDSTRIAEWLVDAKTPLSAALALVPVVGGSAAIITESILERQKERLRDAGRELERVVGDLDLVRRRVETDERLADLLVSLVEVATRTSVAAKRRLAAKIIGESVLDEARIDESELIVEALRDLDAVHFRALAMIWRTQDYFAHVEQLPDPQGAEQVWAKARQYPAPVLTALARHGLVAQTPPIGQATPDLGFMVTRLTGFGHRLLQQLEAVEGDENGQDGDRCAPGEDSPQ